MSPRLYSFKKKPKKRPNTEQPIDDQLLSDILSAWQSAATSSFIQATMAIRVADIDKRKALVDLTGGQGKRDL